MADTKITMYGNQQARYLWAVNGTIPTAERDSLIAKNIPSWDINTSFLTTYSNGLRAGNISFGEDPPERYDIYRLKVGENLMDFVGSVYDSGTALIDYACVNNATYTYLVSIVMGDYITSPVSSNQIQTAWDNWCLLVVDDTDAPNRYTISKAYFFEYNLEVGEMRTNTSVNRLKTFTQYERVQKDSINGLSGALTSLLGRVDCETGEYQNSISMVDAVRELSTDKRKKFLRDIHGNMLCVEIVSDIGLSVSSYSNGEVYKQSLEWLEVSNAKGVCITNKVSVPV